MQVITSHLGNSIGLRSTADEHTIVILDKEGTDNRETIRIKRSRYKEECNIASTPCLYKGSNTSIFVLNNYYVFDMNEMIWFPINKTWNRRELNEVEFARVKQLIEVPEAYIHEIISPLGISNINSMSLSTIRSRIESIPSSLDASKWRVLSTIQDIVMNVIWKYLPLYRISDPIGKMSLGSISYTLDNLHSRRTEFVENEFMRSLIRRKVILPVQSPERIVNQWLVATSTPQSDKAGAIAEIPVHTTLDNKGYRINNAEHCLSLTAIQCPYPKRMLANREVVLRAISQSRRLHKPDVPIVTNEYMMWNSNIHKVDTVNMIACRMEFHGLTNEDGYVISKSASEKMTSFHKAIDKYVLPVGTNLNVEPLCANEDFIISNFSDIMHTSGPFVNRGGIAVLKLNDDGKMKSISNEVLRELNKVSENTSIKSKVVMSRNRGIVTNIERRRIDENTEMVLVETLVRYKLGIGFKIMDRHSHKGTISKILPDWQMPTMRIPGTDKFVKVDIICPSWLGKRCTPSREMEEISSIRFLTDQERTIGKMDDTLELVRNRGTNISKCVFNISPENPYSVLSTNTPVGIVAFAVLNHIPQKKLKYSNSIRTDFSGKTRRGLRNYNFTDGLYAMAECGADSLINEIQSYATKDSNNMHIMYENLNTLGFNIVGDMITIQNEGVFKKEYIGIASNIIRNYTKKSDNDPNPDITDTIYDNKFNLTRVAIELPTDIPLFVEEIMKLLGSKTRRQDHAWRYLKSTRGKNALINRGVPINHVYHNGKEKRYLIIPGSMIYSYVDFTGVRRANQFMNKVNNLVAILSNTKKTLDSGYYNNNIQSQIMRCNILFNDVIKDIAKMTVTKSGIIREVLSPRMPFTSFAVASNASDLDFNEVMVPVRTVEHFCEKEEFRSAYGIPENPTRSWLINRFRESDDRILVMRQPCHRRNEISSYKIRLWSEDCIGINSAAMIIKEGDHDGDALFTYMPISDAARADLMKMQAEDMIKHLPIKKGLVDLQLCEDPETDMSRLREIFHINSGMVEQINEGEHKDRYNEHGHIFSDMEYRKMQCKAAEEFLFIKKGTANSGGIGNIARHLMFSRYGRRGITIGNNINHKFTQASLDSKGSTGLGHTLVATLSALRSMIPPDPSELYKGLDTFLGEDEILALKSVLYDENHRWQGGLNVIAAREVPFSRILYRGNIGYLYRANKKPDEKSFAKFLAADEKK